MNDPIKTFLDHLQPPYNRTLEEKLFVTLITKIQDLENVVVAQQGVISEQGSRIEELERCTPRRRSIL